MTEHQTENITICETTGHLEKLSFCPNAALRAKKLSSEYQLYACRKNLIRALILNQIPNFARYPTQLSCLILGILLLFLPTLSQAAFEKPATHSAQSLLKPELLKGKHFSVADEVQSDGFFYRFSVSSPFGDFTAESMTELQRLVNEIEAIAAMKTVKTDDTAIASAKQAGQNTVTGLKNLFTNPEETLEGAAAGVSSLFNRTRETIGKRKVTDAEDSQVEQVIGLSKAKGKIATQYGVNVYSRNQPLQEELERLAWADYLGGLGVGAATSFIPGVGGVVLTVSGTSRLLNEAINTTPPSELWLQNKNKLLGLGMDQDTVQLFLNNHVFTPALTTVITVALQSMKGVENLELFLKISLQANTPAMARAISEIAVLTAAYHKRVAPLASIRLFGRIVRAEGADGSAVVILPVDRLIWSENVAGLVESLSHEAGADISKQIWMLGVPSEMASAELKKAGYQIHTDVRTDLVPADK